mmetsp:Transcript_901/g.2160  ORF Transcript_901/g.2160 Transcript_901/m.2160 type:complete len:201 (+) Transcript_901:185-787(+)
MRHAPPSMCLGLRSVAHSTGTRQCHPRARARMRSTERRGRPWNIASRRRTRVQNFARRAGLRRAAPRCFAEMRYAMRGAGTRRREPRARTEVRKAGRRAAPGRSRPTALAGCHSNECFGPGGTDIQPAAGLLSRFRRPRVVDGLDRHALEAHGLKPLAEGAHQHLFQPPLEDRFRIHLLESVPSDLAMAMPRGLLASLSK